MSGFPGRSLQRSRKRYPMAWSNLRTRISGLVSKERTDESLFLVIDGDSILVIPHTRQEEISGCLYIHPSLKSSPICACLAIFLISPVNNAALFFLIAPRVSISLIWLSAV